MYDTYSLFGEQVFVDQRNNRIINTLRSENADVLYIAEFPLNRQTHNKEYIQVAFNKEDAKRNKAKISELLLANDTKLSFKLKDKNNEIMLDTKEQLNAVLHTLMRFVIL